MKFPHHKIWRSMVAAWISHTKKQPKVAGMHYHSRGTLHIGRLEIAG